MLVKPKRQRKKRIEKRREKQTPAGRARQIGNKFQAGGSVSGEASGGGSIFHRYAGFFWVFGIAAVCHLAFSRLGFNPTDEGNHTLALARRIFAEGQFPYLDSIVIYAPGGAIIHSFERLAGDYAFWFSRFIFWLQCATTAWFSTVVFTRITAKGEGERRLPLLVTCLLAAVAFIFNVHTFPTLTWQTIDGLFFLTLGMYLIVRKQAARRDDDGDYFWAYAVMGLAYMMKQNFVFAVFGFLLCLGGVRHIKNWIGAALPGAAFLIILLIAGAFDHALLQLGHTRGSTLLVRAASFNGSWEFFLAGVVLGALLCFALRRGSVWQNAFAVFFLGLLIFFAVAYSVFHPHYDPNRGGFVLLGACCAVAAYLFAAGKRRLSGYFLAVAVAGWTASVSDGYPYTVLYAGTMIVALLSLGFRDMETRAINLFLIPVVAVIAVCFVQWRTTYIYREPPDIAQITKPLDGLFPGGRLLLTNERTHAVVEELREIVDRIEESGKRYAIIPEFAPWWAMSRQANLMPVDWFFPVSLGDYHPKLVARLVRVLEREKGRVVFIVQKFDAQHIHTGFRPPGPEYSPIINWLKANRSKTGDAEYYEIYE